jgi:hypothetical protein
MVHKLKWVKAWKERTWSMRMKLTEDEWRELGRTQRKRIDARKKI